MGDETGDKSSFKDNFFLVCAGRRTLSISEDPNNLMSGAGSTYPEPRGSYHSISGYPCVMISIPLRPPTILLPRVTSSCRDGVTSSVDSSAHLHLENIEIYYLIKGIGYLVVEEDFDLANLTKGRRTWTVRSHGNCKFFFSSSKFGRQTLLIHSNICKFGWIWAFPFKKKKNQETYKHVS